MSKHISDEEEVGFLAVQSAARLCQAVRAQMDYAQGAARLDKQDGSPVTIADFGSQAVICRLISERFPDDTIVAEEDSSALDQAENAGARASVTRFVREQARDADDEAVCRWIDRGRGEPESGSRYWVLDPIDGTKGFLRKEQFAVALALIERGAVQRGFLGCPVLPYEGGSGVIFVASRGAGAQAFSLDARPLGPIGVSDVADTRLARFVEGVESAHADFSLASRLKAALGVTAESIRMDSQVKYPVVARGQAEIYFRAPNPRTPDYRENVWDHAAGSIIIEEAGGRVTDIHGRALDWSRGRKLESNVGIIATNGPLHAAVIEALAALLDL